MASITLTVRSRCSYRSKRQIGETEDISTTMPGLVIDKRQLATRRVVYTVSVTIDQNRPGDCERSSYYETKQVGDGKSCQTDEGRAL